MPFYLHVGKKGQSFQTFDISIPNRDTGVMQQLTLGADVDFTKEYDAPIELSIVNKVTVAGAPAGTFIFGKKK